jgi:soluble lytic murein transglycosylase
MRAESHFRPEIRSPVGAIGLMQIMPYTATNMSKLLNLKDFEVSQLSTPIANMNIGVHYLDRLLKKFNSSVPLAAASYNAGPHRMKSWIKSFSNLDIDEFVEHIPFLETRNYVKKVVSNCHVYSKLYSNKKDLFAYLVDPVPFKTDGQTIQKESWDDI